MLSEVNDFVNMSFNTGNQMVMIFIKYKIVNINLLRKFTFSPNPKRLNNS